MGKLLIVKIAFLTTVINCSMYANENQNAAENVILRAYTSIARIEEGKIFLKPEKLCLHQGKIYVEDINGEMFAIPVTFSGAGHPCMQVSESTFFNTWTCSCGSLNHKRDNRFRCWSCGEPR